MPDKADARTIFRTTALLAAMVFAACSAAPVPSSMPPTLPPAESIEPDASEQPALTTAPSDPIATVAPSPRPRPSLDIDPAEVDAYLTSSITFLDLADEDLAVVVTYIDPSSDTPLPLGTYRLDSMGQVTNEAPPGAYVLEFFQPASSTTSTSCAIEIADDEAYVFAALGDAIAISATNSSPTDARELFVATSSLCTG
jgi:hypothetical protein